MDKRGVLWGILAVVIGLLMAIVAMGQQQPLAEEETPVDFVPVITAGNEIVTQIRPVRK